MLYEIEVDVPIGLYSYKTGWVKDGKSTLAGETLIGLAYNHSAWNIKKWARKGSAENWLKSHKGLMARNWEARVVERKDRCGNPLA